MNIDNDFSQSDEVDKMDFEQIYKSCLISKEIIDRLQPLFFLYYSAIIDPNGHHRISNYDLSFDGIDYDGLSIEYSYNDSCNCHPEYTTNQFCIPWEFIEKFHKDPAATKAELTALTAKRKEEELQKKQAEEQRQKQAQLDRERKQFEELKKKFGE